MQPNNPYEQPQVPSNYLDQIAPTAQVKTLNPILLWGLIGGLLIAGIAIVFAVSSASSGPSSSSLTAVAAKLDNLKTTSDKAQKNIRSSELRTVNSSLTLTLINSNRDLAESLKMQEISLKDKKNKTIVSASKDATDQNARLEDARLKDTFDTTYAREMKYSLTLLRNDMTVLYKKSKSKSLKTTLKTGYDNLTPLLEEFSSFNAS